MGGLGSGRREYATTPTVRECRALTADKFTDRVDRPGEGWRWRWGPEEDPSATISVVVCPEDGDAERATALRLIYTVTNTNTGEETEHDYRVPLEYTDCNFGGSRPWFRCPGVVDGEKCGKRVGKLYCPPGRELYLCRHCYDLGYASSRASGDPVETAELRYRRAFAKVDAEDRRPHPNAIDAPPVPDRPKGMHTATYVDGLNELNEAREEWDGAYREKLETFAAAATE